MTKRGKVLRGTEVGSGLITVDGKQYSFPLEGMWQSDVAPRLGMVVDANFDSSGELISLSAVSEGQIAKEQAQKVLSSALAQTSNWRVGPLAELGLLPIAAELLLLLGFFVMSNLSIGAMGFGRSLTGWEAIGINPAMMGGSDRGLLSLLAVFCLLAPVGAPFLQQTWSRWLFVAPACFLVIADVSVISEILKATKGLSDAFGPQSTGLFSIGIGAYVAMLAAVYLATYAFRKYPRV